MQNPKVISRIEQDGGTIETLEPEDGGELYYRTCAHGLCRYSSDLWQAEVYLHQLTAQ